MPALRQLMVLAALLAGLGYSAVSAAQTQVCTDTTSYSVLRATCFAVAATSIDTSTRLEVTGWIQDRAAAGSTTWTRVPGVIAIQEGASVLKYGDASSGNGYAYRVSLDEFSTAATHTLRVTSSGRADSPTIDITVNKFTPRYAMASSATVSRLGQSVQIQTDTETMRPGGTLVFYVKAPGGAATEYARKTITSSYHVIDHDVRSFSFVSPFTASGEYAFSAAYLGDALNAANSSGELVKILVGPFTTSAALAQSSTQTLTGKPVTLTATISGARAGVPLPEGNVEFYDGTTLLGTAALSGQGTAALTTSQLFATGAHSLTARYAGDFNYQPSTSAPISHDVQFDPALLVPVLEMLLDGSPPN